MKKLLISLVRDDQGQDLVEYAMLVALIAIVCVGGVTTFGGAEHFLRQASPAGAAHLASLARGRHFAGPGQPDRTPDASTTRSSLADAS